MQSQESIHAISLQADAAVTPGVEGSYVSSLKTVVQKIETEVIKKITDAQAATQAKLHALFQELESANSLTKNAKLGADQEEQAWFECIAAEQAKAQAVEDAEKSLTTSRSNEKEACQLQQDASPFKFDAKGKYTLKFACDFGKGDCDGALKTWSTGTLNKMNQDADAALKPSQTQYDAQKAACDAATKERAKAQSALSSAEQSMSAQKKMCQKIAPRREDALCGFGTKIQAKCTAESAFKQLVAASKKAKGDDYSEVDRAQEWTAAATTKCLVGKVIENGLGAAVTGADVDTCASGANFGDAGNQLNRKEKEFAALAASNACIAGPISFFNGQTWQVPAGPKPKASEYTRAAFTPQLSLGGGPFAFCKSD